MTETADSQATSPKVSNRHPAEPYLIAFACVLPTFTTLAYFVWAGGAASGVQQGAYLLAKFVQFGLPLLWIGWVCCERLGWPRWSTRGLGIGLAFGAVIGGATWGLYQSLEATWLLQQAIEPIREKIAGFQIDSAAKFAALGAFYSICHSLMEEYYWRWFVFGRMSRWLSFWPAAVLSALFFASHHVVLLWHYFSHSPLIVVFLSLSVAVGGIAWAWLYRRSESIYAPWLSHLLVDAAIFAVGYDIAM